MLKSGLLFLLLFGSVQFSLIAQGGPTTLLESTQRYLNATQLKDWKTVLDSMNPKIFLYVSKPQLEQIYRQMENDPGMKVQYTEMEILNIKSGYILSDTNYIPVDYAMTLQIQLNPQLYPNPEDINHLHQGFEKTYAGQEVLFDQETSSFWIEIKNTLIASSVNGTDQWYFSEYKANDPLLSKILPLEVLARLEKGWSQ